METAASTVSLISSALGMMPLLAAVLFYRGRHEPAVRVYLAFLMLFSLNLFADGILLGTHGSKNVLSFLLDLLNVLVSSLMIPVLLLLAALFRQSELDRRTVREIAAVTGAVLTLSSAAYIARISGSGLSRMLGMLNLAVWSTGMVLAMVLCIVAGIQAGTRSRSPQLARFLITVSIGSILFLPFFLLRDILGGLFVSTIRIELLARPLFFIFWNIASVIEFTRYLRDNRQTVKETGRWEHAAESAGLTARETEVAKLLASGVSYGEIAEKLCISLPTVKSHASKVYAKTGLSNRISLSEWVRSL